MVAKTHIRGNPIYYDKKEDKWKWSDSLVRLMMSEKQLDLIE